MKVVVLPGVNVYEDNSHYENFLIKIKNALKCQGEVFIWEIGWQHPETDLPYKNIRDFTCSVILDFQQAIKHAMKTYIPEADIYIGHSAGSIIALAHDKPCVIFGSPAMLTQLIEQREKMNMCASDSDLAAIVLKIQQADRPILNIINKYDILAYPLDQSNVENYVYSGSKLNPFGYFPITAHHDYWESKKVVKKIIKTLKNWT